MLKTKSVWSPISGSDGLRVLATRFRGRGLKVDRYDVWMANLGPSEVLLRKMQSGEIPWSEFVRRYKEEMFADSEVDRGNETIKNHGQKFTLRLLKQLAKTGDVTLMCLCDEDQQHCHRHVLRQVILSNKV